MSPGTQTSGGLRDFRVAESLVGDTRHFVDGPVVWEAAPPAKRICVLNVQGAPAGTRIRMVVLEHKLSEPKVSFIHPDGWVRRLCLNTKHEDLRGTHKHCIINGDVESAYTPTDIPQVPLSRYVSAGVHREIMEAFLNECNISLGPNYRWSDPYPKGGAS